MDTLIRVDGAGGEVLRDLFVWLNDESDLRGTLRLLAAPVEETELGGIVDAIAVAVGAGGAGTVLASSLVAWLQTRRSAVRLVVQRGKRQVTLEIHTSERMLPLIQRLLESGDEP